MSLLVRVVNATCWAFLTTFVVIIVGVAARAAAAAGGGNRIVIAAVGDAVTFGVLRVAIASGWRCIFTFLILTVFQDGFRHGLDGSCARGNNYTRLSS